MYLCFHRSSSTKILICLPSNFSSWKRLEKEDSQLYSVIKQEEGFECEIGGYSYRVGQNKYGLYLLRKSLNGLENIPNLESDKPQARPVGFTGNTPAENLQTLRFDVES